MPCTDSSAERSRTRKVTYGSAFNPDDACRAVSGGLFVGFAFVFPDARDVELTAAAGFAFHQGATPVFMRYPPAEGRSFHAGVAADAFVALKKDADQNRFW